MMVTDGDDDDRETKARSGDGEYGPRPHRHQAWDDQGLGIRRSGVLPSHARANGSLPIP